MRLALTGGTGFVGQAVLDEAGRRGWQVTALARRDMAPREGVDWVRGDLADHAALARLAQGADAVLHVAGVVSAPDKAGFAAGNVDGTRAVVDAARDAGVARFVHVSSLAAREPGLSDYGHSKRLAEEVVQVSGLDWTVVRPPAIYGPRDTEMFELFRAARWCVLPMPPRGRASYIHVEDLARLLLDLVPAREAASGRIFEPDDGHAGGWSHQDVGHAIGRAVGRRVWAPSLPGRLLTAAARLDRKLRGDKAKLTPDRARYMAHPDWTARAERAVPGDIWQPRIGLEAGLAETARWYGEAGWL
ncbi:NAD-dependent epimerase/dehydratase family protein [Aurantiacibacter luteus]|uniref:Epimerase n=1 Tax=Aurantiacibacter luteus TaxID=1581420 RepID=A0A0G9MSZ0_9SPHN|nr:NAD(P)H-binding protein [Aurantiacibacter luteus]KLE33845.1 epimerase [Aurantiacibacter luteus]